MKIKKKDLRKGEAQLPINYPAPDLDDVFAFSLEEEKSRVENLCRRLAHNEAQVREAVLAELPRYVQEVTQRAADVERRIGIAALQQFTRMQRRKEQLRRQRGNRGNKGNKGNKGNYKEKEKEENAKNTDDGDDEDEVNVLRALDIYRDRTANVSREQRRRLAIQQLQQSHSHEEGEEEEKEEERENGVDCHALRKGPATRVNNGSLRQQYRVWVAAWAEAELLLLKLSRGLFFCLWHTDKPLVQLDCARRIAHLITAPQDMSGKVLLFSCLMRILAREWRTMDRYRSDKFLALVRRLVNECAVLMKSAEAEALRLPQGKPLDRAAGSEKQNKALRKRRNSTAQKRKRGEEEEEEAEEEAEKEEKEEAEEEKEEKNKTVEDVTRLEPLRRLLGEACYVFRAQIVPDPSAVGLAMHVADILFDELCRAALSPRLFVALSDRIALHAMSRGNYVEKRVLDHFIAPMAGGRLAAARLRADTETETHSNNETKSTTTTSGIATTATTTATAVAESEAEANGILLALAERCRQYAVARRTVRAVRVMFTESECALRQAADPEAYEEDTRRAGRRRLEREVTEVDETRRAVIAERRNVRLLRQQEKRKTSGKTGGAEDMGAGKKKTARKAKVAPRDTKRKKHYKLTKEDLYGEEE